MPKKVALLIGVSEYGENISPLLAPPNDVLAMELVLKNPNMGGFDEVRKLINPDLSQMQIGIQEIFEDRAKDDLVLLFFSGHGITDNQNKLYLATKGTSKRAYKASSVSAQYIQDLSLDSYAKRQIIILDCCYSGAFAEGWQAKSVDINFQQQLGAEGRVVLTSSTATQTSFQQEGEELSLYTRYLVDGIETGVADNDRDGKIHTRELHGYAKAKVQEVKPKQTPDIITYKEGFNIVISKAPSNDPELEFRRFVEQYFDRHKPIQGKISIPAQAIFLKKQLDMGITDGRAKEIIDEVLDPYRHHQKKIEAYQEVLRKTVEDHYPLNAQDEDELKYLQNELGLGDQDIASFQQEILAKKAAEHQKLPQTYPSKATSSPIEKPPVELISEKGVDYSQLCDLLAAGKWREADEETTRVMCLAAGREKEGWLRVEDMDNFPCEDLRTINQLWLHYSNGKFGFSVQKEIYQSLGGTREYNDEVWKKFGDRVGWRVEGEWLSYKDLFNNLEAEKVNLPSGKSYFGVGGHGGSLLSRKDL
jgi:hypothetical protein